MQRLGSASLWVFVVDWALRLVLVVRVILRRTPVPMSLAWLLMLVLIPVPFVSAFVYVLVGENRLGHRRAREFGEVTRRIEQQSIPLWSRSEHEWFGHEEPFQTLATMGTAVGGLPPLKGNQLELMGDASAVLRRLATDIDQATSHCHLMYYIWMPKGGGLLVAEALGRAARRGVQCRVLVDAVGSKDFLRSELPERLRDAGVEVVAALPVNPLRLLFARLDLRNHRKIAVIDGTTAYCGSQNLTDETFRNRHRKKIGPWIDATVRMRGPAAQALQTIFLTDWSLDAEKPLPDLRAFFPRLEPSHGGSVVHVVPSGPGPQPEAIRQAVLTMIFAAREEIIMTTPYFVPDEATKGALVNAALRGVEVTIVVPDKLDARVVAAASRSHFEDLLVAGVRILEHQQGLLHAKTATVDRKLAFVSSVNFDMRSFWLNFEATLFLYDDDFASILRFMQTGYMAQSTPIFLDEWKSRAAWRRFVDNTAQLFGPLL